MSNFYETMYIMRPDISDEAVDNTIGKVKISESKSEFLPCMSHFLGSGVYL